jgi:crossover junction endodeoxyribonuclease RuvC
MRVLGVDPGSVSAAFAILDFGHNPSAMVADVPVVDRQVNAAEWARFVHHSRADVAVVEKVSAMPKQGISSTFKFGMGAGLLRGVIAGAGIPIHDVAPTVWKKHFRLDNDGEKSRALAIRRFPQLEGLHLKKHHNRSEALLLALWFLETHPGAAQPGKVRRGVAGFGTASQGLAAHSAAIQGSFDEDVV